MINVNRIVGADKYLADGAIGLVNSKHNYLTIKYIYINIGIRNGWKW